MDDGTPVGDSFARRAFLRWVGTGGAVGAVATLVPGAAAAAPRDVGATQRTAYRLSTRGQRACGACRNHAANRYYRTLSALGKDRAHVGCNCRLVTQPLHVGTYKQYFNGRDVWDLRWKRPPGRGHDR